MQKQTTVVIAALAAGLVATDLASRPVQSGDPTPKDPSDKPPARIFLEPLARPDGEGNARIRVGGSTRTLSLDLHRCYADQKRYAEQLGNAKQVVSLSGRQKRCQGGKDRRKYLALKLESGHEEELPQFVGLPELDPDEEQLLIKNCLLITDLNVVEDPERTTGPGPWTFGTLMTNLANRSATGIEPANFVRQWLGIWEGERGKKINELITEPWQAASGGDGKPLDLTKAPFRLLAIVNRLDVRSNHVLGLERIGGGGAGEARFVFCAVDAKQEPLLFTVILEFQIKRKSFHEVREWAEQWYALKDLPRGSTRYNKALQKITDQFAAAGTDPESPPNQSALSQLRTNEFDLGSELVIHEWEMREFRIDVNNGGYLRQVTAKQTPHRVLSDDSNKLNQDQQASLAKYVNQAQRDILAQEHRVPLEFPPGQSFLACAVPMTLNEYWQAPGIDPEARHLFSLGTCSGCHAREAFPTVSSNTFDLKEDRVPPHFTHVRPRQIHCEARLSPFLTGKDENGAKYKLDDPAGQRDPGAPGQIKQREFHDLSNRAHDLAGLVEYGVIYEIARRPLQMIH